MYLIYGKGAVGNAVARLCHLQNIDFEICDDSDNISDFSRYEKIIPSPGIPSHHKIYTTGKIFPELDFAFQFLPKNFKIIAITGTDGKSTTTHMLYSILQKYHFGKQKKIFISGNFEIPFSETVAKILENNDKNGIIVIEISSFMTFCTKNFSPDYTIFTNFKSDHLNWHADLQEYLDAKMNLVRHTKKISAINSQIFGFAQEKNLKIFPPENMRIFGLKNSQHQKDYTDGENIVISGRKKYALSETQFSGEHNAMNILSVAVVLSEMKICSKQVKKILTTLSGLPHRIETIGEKNGIIFVDDSKSTSAQSLEAALGAFGKEKNILLIAGGSDKGDSFFHLGEKFSQRVKAVACIGVTKKQFSDIAEKNNIPFLETDSLIEATKWLYNQGKMGNILMLSPGCASFGLFKDYLDRANKFKEAIDIL